MKEKAIKIKELPQKCGQWEAVQPVYKKLIGKSGRTWLVPIGKYAADNVHVSDPSPNSRGYAGATLKFNLEDGTVLELKGPWHGEAIGLFKDTGCDIRNKYSTKVIIAERVEYDKGEYQPTLTEILYEDEDFVEGLFNRGVALTQEFADKLNKPIFYYVETIGGAHSGWQKPGEK